MLKQQLQNINVIVAVGSTDGVLTTAVLLRQINKPGVELIFTQAFQVGSIDISLWQPGSVVAFVDLAVNNQKPEMTAEFVQRIKNAGHKIIAIIDEHDRKDWLEVMGSFEELVIEPHSQKLGVYKSSGAVLKAALGDLADSHAVEMCNDADAADRMDFSTRFGAVVNSAMKAKIEDNDRRVFMARWFAQYRRPGEDIYIWMEEYKAILATNAEVMADGEDLGNGILMVNTEGKKVDMTTLLNTLYQDGWKVVGVKGIFYNKVAKGNTLQVSFGTDTKGLQLMTALKEAGIPILGGMEQKVNVDPEHEAAALAVIREAIKKI